MTSKTAYASGCNPSSGERAQEQARKVREDESRKALAARLGKIGHKILVMSGKGGVGKSTVAANFAVALAAQGYRVGLLDVDVHGPTIPQLLNLSGRRPGATPNGVMAPVPYNERLKVISIAFLLEGRDTAVIWRGPMKHGAIEQLLRDVDWGDCDYLIIDSPPGTGDEPLSVCQLISDADGAVLVTTPQSVATADVRKSITFCRQVRMPVLGVIENMSGYTCPHCGRPSNIMKSGGGETMAREMSVTFLGRLPFDPRIVDSGDVGRPYVEEFGASYPADAFHNIMKTLISTCESKGQEDLAGSERSDETRVFAIPTTNGVLASHFGHCAEFAFITADCAAGVIGEMKKVAAPEHEPGLLPRWLAEQGADIILAGGMGSRAQQLFAENGIEVVTGVPELRAKEIVEKYLNDNLVTGGNACNH